MRDKSAPKKEKQKSKTEYKSDSRSRLIWLSGTKKIEVR